MTAGQPLQLGKVSRDMLRSIISIILNVLYFVILNIPMYTDKAHMADGSVREWHRSPVDRLNISDMPWLFYLQIAISVICTVTSLLMMFGVKVKVVRTIQLISLIVSAIVFVAILIITSNSHAKYA